MTVLVLLDSLTPAFDLDLPSAIQNSVVSIGNFDGVHHGHQSLLRQSGVLAKTLGDAPIVAVTFDPHPAALLRPDSAPVPLTNMHTRADRMSALGVEALIVCRTTPDLLRLSPQAFFQNLIVDQLKAVGMVEGPNFFFGKDRKGDVDVLTQLCKEQSIEFQVASVTDRDGEMISSSRLRSCLNDGDVNEFASLCGHLHRISGVVSKGQQRGRTIGFPTANLSGIDVAIPANGVYAGIGEFEGKRMPAAIHIGPNPTFNENEGVKVEVHLIGYHGDLYGKTLVVDFVDQIREIIKFESADDLTRQLQKDIEVAGQRTASII